ncbi:hypothetical protein DRW42_18940 [Pedobacter miscanthi]|uniref:Uncharacterized protein n=1 Tax=Pedobacter miscanthi TaxID=2259170 RepID=A0A366KRY6_9SPHI|nr:hypothetical protein DRW42_18940 [Pedobacter miscanthi]
MIRFVKSDARNEQVRVYNKKSPSFDELLISSVNTRKFETFRGSGKFCKVKGQYRKKKKYGCNNPL